MSVRSSVLRHLETDLLRFLLWLGPVTVQQWHNNQNLYPDISKPSHGYGFTLATALDCYLPFRLELAVFLIRSLRGPSANLSFHWTLSWPRVVPWDAKIVDLVVCGDVDAVRREISTGRSAALDVVPDGLTLLHVCCYHCTQRTPADTTSACCVAGSL